MIPFTSFGIKHAVIEFFITKCTGNNEEMSQNAIHGFVSPQPPHYSALSSPHALTDLWIWSAAEMIETCKTLSAHIYKSPMAACVRRKCQFVEAACHYLLTSCEWKTRSLTNGGGKNPACFLYVKQDKAGAKGTQDSVDTVIIPQLCRHAQTLPVKLKQFTRRLSGQSDSI